VSIYTNISYCGFKRGPKLMPAGNFVPSKWTLPSCDDTESFICDLSFAFPEKGRTSPGRSEELQDLNK
jgi:hypothetical protein